MVQADKEMRNWDLVIDDRVDMHHCSDAEREEIERAVQEVIAIRKNKRLINQ